MMQKRPLKKIPKKATLNVVILSGEKDPERAVFGLAYALAAAAMKYKVVVFLAMGGAILANQDLEDRIIVEKYHSIPRYLELLLEFGVKITVCSSCIEKVCDEEFNEMPSNFNIPNSFTKPKILRAGITVQGITSLLSIAKATNTVVF